MHEITPEAALPPLYAGWVREMLSGPVPEETRATCGDCAMRPPDGQSEGSAGYFHPIVKCCTYVPQIPNFLAGGILRDADPALEYGRTTFLERMRVGDGVTPLGLAIPRRYRLWYEGGQGFGRSEALKCPHYIEDGGLCGIWRHRNSVCCTWFCKHNRGAVGASFWRAVQGVLARIERALSWWCVLELDPGAAAIQRILSLGGGTGPTTPLTAEEINGDVNPAVYRACWGTWLGREEEFYRACSERVGALAWEEVAQIGGPELGAFVRITRESYTGLMSDEVPARLRPGTFTIVESTPSRATVTSYRQFDPLSLPQTLISVLPQFDGRPTEEVLQFLAAERKLRVAPELVRKLVDYEVLVPAPDPA